MFTPSGTEWNRPFDVSPKDSGGTKSSKHEECHFTFANLIEHLFAPLRHNGNCHDWGLWLGPAFTLSRGPVLREGPYVSVFLSLCLHSPEFLSFVIT